MKTLTFHLEVNGETCVCFSIDDVTEMLKTELQERAEEDLPDDTFKVIPVFMTQEEIDALEDFTGF